MNFDPKKTVFLIDASSFLYRAYYSMRPLHTSKGIPVQAVYGFCRMIKKLMDTFKPEYMALVWDSKGKTTRHELYPEYKATRSAPPSDLFVQKEYIVRFADAIGLAQVQQQGIEADDIMYSIAKEQAKAGSTVVLVTSDKDMGQALTDKIVMYDTFKDTFIDTKSFLKDKGFSVDRLVLYYSLVGDASDNIPGVKGIGKTGALELVKQYATLDDLYKHITDIENKRTRTALQVHKDDAYLSEKLFTLHYQPSGLTKTSLAFDAAKWGNAREVFQEVEFKSMLQEGVGSVKKNEPVALENVLAHYTFTAVTTMNELNELCKVLASSDAFAMDTETTGLSPLQDPIIGISFCVREGLAYYIPFGHTASPLPQLERSVVLQALKPLLENPKIKKYLHNVKFDWLVLYNAGIKLAGVYFDTMIAAHLLVPEWQRIGLKNLSEFYFQEPMLTFTDVVKNQKLTTFAQVPLDIATKYAAADAHQTLKLYHKLAPELAKEPAIERLFYDIEMPLDTILCAMEARGIYLDVTVLHDIDRVVTARLRALEAEIVLIIGPEAAEINLGSPKQVQELLFVKLQLPPQKKSAKGLSYSTDQEVLEILAALHPVPKLIMQHRELSKLKSTYIDTLPTYSNPTTGKIHTTFSQTAVATGRLASSDPNLQNIPVVGYGIEIRAAFKPEAGHLFLSADYSQVELRVLAHMSGDANLINAFLEGRDIHTQTASGLFEVPLDKVSHEQRQIGKRINFSILYGLTPFGLSKDLGIPYKDAKMYIDKYFAQYPGVSLWMEQTIEFAKRYGYVETVWGRRRYVPAILERNKSLYEEACRVAINTRVQGTAAEIMKKGMIELDKAIAASGLEAYMLLQIHDELLLTVNKQHIEQVGALVKKTLEDVVQWKAPLEVTITTGADWKAVS